MADPLLPLKGCGWNVYGGNLLTIMRTGFPLFHEVATKMQIPAMMRRGLWQAEPAKGCDQIVSVLTIAVLDLATHAGIDPRIAGREDLQRGEHRVARLQHRHHRHVARRAQRRPDVLRKVLGARRHRDDRHGRHRRQHRACAVGAADVGDHHAVRHLLDHSVQRVRARDRLLVDGAGDNRHQVLEIAERLAERLGLVALDPRHRMMRWRGSRKWPVVSATCRYFAATVSSAPPSR